MAKIEIVKKITNKIKPFVILVSCTNKNGLVDNKTDKTLPANGLLGYIQENIPNVLFISTGGTYKILKQVGLNVKEVSEITKYPEMKSGLVKSLHPAIHAGLLAHKHTNSDDQFMKQQGIKYIDALIVNFYPLDEMLKQKNATFEMLRQTIDVGGPTMAHNARKAFISTCLITDPKQYPSIITELKNNNNCITLNKRLELAKYASTMITNYMLSIDKLFQTTEYKDFNCYEAQNGHE